MTSMDAKSKKLKSQSAMEYLTTYGWAIGIITVILALLFTLNIFNAGASIATSCTSQPGYSCTGITMSSKGLLTFTFAQSVSPVAYNAQFACIASSSIGSPDTAAYTAQSQTGYGKDPISPSGPAGMQSANIIHYGAFSVNNIQCYTSTGSTGFPIGTAMEGQIWMAYTNAQQPAPDNIFVQVASFTAKSSS